MQLKAKNQFCNFPIEREKSDSNRTNKGFMSNRKERNFGLLGKFEFEKKIDNQLDSNFKGLAFMTQPHFFQSEKVNSNKRKLKEIEVKNFC